MSKRQSRGGRAPRTTADEEELADLCGRIAEVARRVFLTKPHARNLVRSMPPMDLSVKIDFSGRPDEVRADAHRAFADLNAHIDDAILTHAAFRPGAAYCFFCEESACEHTHPDDPRHVFRGYSEVGTPVWCSLLDLALERGENGVEELARERGARVVIRSGRDELVRDRIRAFAATDRAYDVRGQLAMGYYQLRGCSGASEKFAVTLQVIRSSTRSRVVRLGVNTLGVLPDGRSPDALLDGPDTFSYLELLRSTERRLAAVNRELKTLAAGERMNRAAETADRLLADMAQGFGRRTRRKEWRTGHAVQRAGEGTRPTGMARQDLASAKADRVFFDRKEKTYVVMGSNGRTHVFSSEGRHVTSLHLEKKSIDGRIAHNRWRRLAAQEAADVLERITRRVD